MCDSNCLIWNADFYFIRQTVTLNATTRMIVFHLTTFIIKLINYYTTFFQNFPFCYRIPSFPNGVQLNVFTFFKNDIVKSVSVSILTEYNSKLHMSQQGCFDSVVKTLQKAD